jgi:hypothetical protein
MILATLVAATLVVPVSIDRSDLAPSAADRGMQMSARQKDAKIRPLVSSATECIVRAVSTDPRYSTAAAGADLSDLIVASVPSCLTALRSMIEAYDRLFGDGSGETFFMGPYLDGLPAAVSARVKGIR